MFGRSFQLRSFDEADFETGKHVNKKVIFHCDQSDQNAILTICQFFTGKPVTTAENRLVAKINGPGD
jgi:hypothetical protein